MIRKIFGDKTLFLLVLLSAINAICALIGGSLINVKYITLIATFILLVFSKKDKSLPILFYIHCNSALYDDINFGYFFNVSLMIVLLKEIFFYKSKFNKKTVFLLAVLVFYDLFLLLINDTIGVKILSNVSWIASYLLLITYSYEKKVEFDNLYSYFFIGFIMSCVCAFVIPFNTWGLNIPVAYRFTGLLRDPNYYSVDALLLIFSANTYSKYSKKNPIVYILIISILGILSVSKMFILLLIGGIGLSILYNLKKAKPYQLIVGSLVIIIATIFIYNSNFLDLIVNKYAYRTETTSLLTGRDKIQKYYLTYAIENPATIMFGKSTRYSVILDVGGYMGDSFYNNMVAHNTFIDVLMSWGIFFTIFYIYFISAIIKKSYKQKIKNKLNICDYKVLIIVILLSLMSLSYLTADFFALLILYIILVSKEKDEVDIYEKN